MKLSKTQTTHPRYSRQILFDGIKSEGQALISASRVAIVGCGALGAVQSSLLVRAGVGTLRIIDRDFVDESNLQRQILFDEEDGRAIINGTYDMGIAKSLYARYIGN
jgi:molybdopterin-synthase adenylyltransferase